MSLWGAIEPAELPQYRLRLDFGLRPSILALNEWAAPGLGGAFFVRQLTWSCLGLLLAEELNRPSLAARIAESIEALASWIALKGQDYEKDDRVQGKRKLRNVDGVSFNAFSTGGAYVTVPFRRAATAALPGLGLCSDAQSRFNNLQLAPAGVTLGRMALRNEGVAKRLRNWILEPDNLIKSSSAELKEALLPGLETRDECRLVLDHLLADAERARLIRLLEPLDMALSPLQSGAGIDAFLDRVDDIGQRARLDACFAFERVRSSALKSAQTLIAAIKAQPQSWVELAGADDVQREFDILRRDCDALATRLDRLAVLPPGLREFCAEQRHAHVFEQRIRALATRLPQVFTVQAQVLDRGMGYTDSLAVADADEPVEGEAVPASVLVPRPLLRLKRLYQESLEGMSE